MKPEELLQSKICKTYNDIKYLLNIRTKLFSNRNENSKGGWKGKVAGAIYNKMGRAAGMPDLTLLWHDRNICFIEIKTEKAYFTRKGIPKKNIGLSKEQQKTHKELKELGFDTYVIYSVESFVDLLNKILQVNIKTI